MALAGAPLAQVCRMIADYLGTELSSEGSIVPVSIGAPAHVQGGADGPPQHHVNLFFFRLDTSGFFPDGLPGQNWMIRAHCLVTPFGADEGPGRGENDLRLLGEVLRVFHERPSFSVNLDDENFLVQIVFHPLALEQINQLWSTQGDVVYRPSVAYEMSLVPVIPKRRNVDAPLTGSVALEVRANVAASPGTPRPWTPAVPRLCPDTNREDWAPAVCFIRTGRCEQALSFALGTSDLASFVAEVWVAGEPGVEVALRWDVWDAGHGWSALEPSRNATIVDRALAVDRTVSAPDTVAIELPFKNHTGQMVLYAERSWLRAADGAVLKVRSNPLLVNVYEEAP